MRRSASYSYRGRGTLETPGPSGEQETPLTLSSDGTAAPGDQEIENEAVSDDDDDGGGGKHGERMSTPILKAFEMVVNKGEKERRKPLYYDCHLCDKVSVCN